MHFSRVNIIIFFVFTSCVSAQSSFDRHFIDQSMRVDFILAGNTVEQNAYVYELKKEPFWGGNKSGLIDVFNYGEYRYCVVNKATADTIYSRGFSTLFEEWRTTLEAKTANKAFFQTITFPFPKQKVILSIDERLKDGSYNTLLRQEINPRDDNIRIVQQGHIETVKIIDNGSSDQNLDLTFIAEGYTAEEMDKFKGDVKRHAEYLLDQAPFINARDKINIWAICSPSSETGPTEPEKDRWKETAVNSSFNTFYIDRYLESTDVKSIRDIAASAPYDHIVVLVNSKRYGGGGIYNHFSIGTSDHPLAEKVLIHEIGHGLFGLADEYYTSDVAYQNFFSFKVEPWQPNITTLVDFESKWKSMISSSTPIPTPATSTYNETTGVFEGGGYVAKGIYRPAINCRMKSNEAKGFCEVCVDAGTQMINFLTQKTKENDL